MTTSSEFLSDSPAVAPGPILSDDLLWARDRTAQQRVLATRALERGRARRRILPTAVVGSALLVTAGLADRFVLASQPRATLTAIASSTPVPSSSNLQTLAQVTQTLAADQRAIAAIAKTQAQLVASTGADGGGSVATPNIQLPTLPSLPSIPSVAVPAPSAAPVTHATTGASVVIP